MTRLPILTLAVALAGCTAANQQTAKTIATDVAQLGQLYCQLGPTIVAIAGVSVVNASAASVAAACAVAPIVGAVAGAIPVPVPGPAGVVVPVVAVPAPVVDAVAASRVG